MAFGEPAVLTPGLQRIEITLLDFHWQAKRLPYNSA
jgi:hypothetical protein